MLYFETRINGFCFLYTDNALTSIIMRNLAIIFSLTFLFVSCSRESLTTDPTPDTAQPVVYMDFAYGSQSLQKMDVFLPGGRSVDKTKTIVVIHGGAWVDGDKSDMAYVVDSLKKRLPAFALVNLNYRLAINGSINVFPSQEMDVKMAIESYLAKSANYGISQDIVLLGGSAGAHLALLHGYKNDPDRHVKAVIDFFGPTDLTAIWNEGFFQQLALMAVTGKTYAQDPAIYTQSSPITFINAQSPPTIVLQGGMDDIVVPEQSYVLIAKLNSYNVPHQLVFYPNEGHGFSASNNIDALLKSLSFIAQYVK